MKKVRKQSIVEKDIRSDGLNKRPSEKLTLEKNNQNDNRNFITNFQFYSRQGISKSSEDYALNILQALKKLESKKNGASKQQSISKIP